MKTLAVYYSLTGKTETIVRTMQDSLNADVVEIRELSDRGRLSAHTFGCISSRFKKASNTFPMDIDISDYGNIIIASPVWGGYPAPAIYNFIRGYQLKNKNVYGILCYSKKIGEAENILKKEFDNQNIPCKAIVSIKSNSPTMEGLCFGNVFFDIDKRNNLVLKEKQKDSCLNDQSKKTVKKTKCPAIAKEKEVDFSYNKNLSKNKKSPIRKV